jgi:hypothetical protein
MSFNNDGASCPIHHSLHCLPVRLGTRLLILSLSVVPASAIAMQIPQPLVHPTHNF